MSTLTARHKWCAERILFCFANREDKENDQVQFDKSRVDSFLRKPKVLAKFNDFFSAEGPGAIFVHYQQRQANELDALDQKDANGKQPKKSELFISYGDSALMNSKCCYFLRQGAQEIDSSVANDTSLLYGELLDSPLETIKSLLSSTYAPLFAESSEWGSTNEEQKADFNEEMNKFMRNLTSAVESISGGLELRHLASSHIESLESSSGQNAAQNPEAIAHLEELIEEWCSQIEDFIESREKSSHRQESSAEESSTDQLEGPKGEIEHWRARTQHLSSIIEQLKRKDCRYVVGILSSYTKGTNDPAKSKTIVLLRRWKQIDIETTEAANEAKDNLKYLSTLQRFIEPLYSGTAQSIIDTLPALINSIKVRHSDLIYFHIPE